MKPFKVSDVPVVNQNADRQTRLVEIEPAKDDGSVNGDVVDEVPDHPPQIAWPKSEPLEQSGKPYKLR